MEDVHRVPADAHRRLCVEAHLDPALAALLGLLHQHRRWLGTAG